jgi:hypothetical protein
VPAKSPYSLSGSWNCSGSTSASSPRLACASATTSADGPSRAGPISERVVKPDALGEMINDEITLKN